MSDPTVEQPVTSLEVLSPGPMTTVQDLPGRVGYWHVGVPPNGPMDDLSHRLANRVVGNAEGAAALELTGSGPTLRATGEVVVALVGAAMPIEVDGRPAATGTPLTLAAGSTISIGVVAGAGLRAALAMRGGIEVPTFLGSRSTFTLGRFGGLDGRALETGDRLAIGDACEDRVVSEPGALPPGLAPELTEDWELGVLVGPHTAPEFLTPEGLDALLAATWTVHFNSARTGVRLIGPRPRWARSDGGEAGLHPSNIHDTGYAIGAVDLTGDMPVILGPDGPSLGGFVCPAVVAASERWKLGQLGPGDRVRLVAWSAASAASADRRRDDWLTRAVARIEPLARPAWNGTLVRSGTTNDAVLGRLDATDDRPEVTYRQAGDRFLLVEYGDMALDLELRLRVHALDRWVGSQLGDGLVDATAGVRSLLVQVDGERLTVARALDAVRAAQDELDDVADEPFESRIVHLPLSWDDPATREAIERYMHGVRDDAPWCPWNIEFIRRINGLDSVDDVHRIVFDASYLVLGLGDVYLGAPVATPLDPRHRLVTTKYNPARTWTAENSVGIGGAYLCIYGMEGPGGYQFVGRTVQVWNQHCAGPHFTEPWLLRTFDQLRWFPVGADELLEMRDAQLAGALPIEVEHTAFRLTDHRRFLVDHAVEIDRFGSTQRAAFAEERERWAAAGEFDDVAAA
ncbi:MAG TPA: 5-oxoprolinase/urea amidolyase family protein [Microthrixaceae bacterium]|nr:5-oxoprolinase/urea amidolyase family protein [Microthrixaceae bacterium]